MQRTRFTAEQIRRILQEAEALGNVREICRPHQSAAQTFYRWRQQLGGRDVSEAKRLRALERENAALKRRVGELPLDKRRLKDVLGKKWCAWLPGVVWQHISNRRTA